MRHVTRVKTYLSLCIMIINKMQESGWYSKKDFDFKERKRVINELSKA